MEVFENSMTIMRNSTMPGEFTEERTPTSEVQMMCEQVRSQVETRMNRMFSCFNVVEYCSQSACGTNYRCRMQVSETRYICIQFFVGLGDTCRPMLTEIFDNMLTMDENRHLFMPGMVTPMMEGRFSRERCATSEIQRMIEEMRMQVEQRASMKCSMFRAMQYCEQVTCGMNYRIRVQVSEKQCIVMEVFVGLGIHVRPVLTRIMENMPSMCNCLMPMMGSHMSSQMMSQMPSQMSNQMSSHMSSHMSGPVIMHEMEPQTMVPTSRCIFEPRPMVPGFSEIRCATPEIQEMCDEVRPQVEMRMNRPLKTYMAMQYIQQASSGMNYRIIMRVGPSRFVVIHINMGLGVHARPELMDLREDCMSLHDRSELKMGMGMGMGSYSKEIMATPEMQRMADEMRHSVEMRMNRKFSMFRLMSFCEQVVAGMNYRMRIQVGENEYVVVQVFVGLDVHERPELTSARMNEQLMCLAN